jgi:predicted HicB family RNase H-like nuclease
MTQTFADRATRTIVTFLVRLPPDLHAQLAVRAQEDNRSLNNLIVTWLRRGLDAGW